MKKRFFHHVYNASVIALGNFLLAFAVVGFIEPCNLVSGGCTGIALLLNRLFHYPVASVVLVLNVVLFLLGLLLLGKKFALGTLLSNILYPLFLHILDNIPQLGSLTDDKMLATIFGSVFMGLGVGLVFKVGASTGGVDPLTLALHKYCKVPLSVGVYLIDTIIILVQVCFTDSESILFGIVFVLLSSMVIDKVSLFGDSKIQVITISDKYREICDAILHDCNMGSTLFNIETGYNGQPQKAVMTIIHKRFLNQLQKTITTIDPTAFIQISTITAVHGRGFTIDREQ